MRYTTVIDLTEFPELWQNPNVVRLYYYLAMKCGYHDNDRDIIRISLRTLSGQTNLTLSAIRHSIKVLIAHGLVAQEKDYFRILKFVLEKKPTSRTQANTMATDDNFRRHEIEVERRVRRIKEIMKDSSVEQIESILERLNQGKRTSYQGEVFYPSSQMINYLERCIEYKKNNK